MAQLAFSAPTPAEPLTCDIARTGGMVAFACGDAKLRLWLTAESRLAHTLALGEREIDLTRISADGRWTVTGSHTGAVVVWNTSTGEAHMRLRILPYPWPATFSPDSKLLAISPMGGATQVIDLATRQKRFEFASHLGGANAISFSRDGARMATVDQDCVVRIYDARSGRLLARNEDFLFEPIAVDFTADGRHVIAGGVDRVSVYIDASNGKVSHRMDRDAEPAYYLFVSEDGRRFGVQFLKADNMLEPASVTVWEVESRRKVVEWMPPSVVLSIAWTRDGSLLASTAKKTALDVWRVL
jgi:WD40 repeat protein